MCKGCVELADEAKAKLERELAIAKARAQSWLDDHICAGGLLKQEDCFSFLPISAEPVEDET